MRQRGLAEVLLYPDSLFPRPIHIRLRHCRPPGLLRHSTLLHFMPQANSPHCLGARLNDLHVRFLAVEVRSSRHPPCLSISVEFQPFVMCKFNRFPKSSLPTRARFIMAFTEDTPISTLLKIEHWDRPSFSACDSSEWPNVYAGSLAEHDPTVARVAGLTRVHPSHHFLREPSLPFPRHISSRCLCSLAEHCANRLHLLLAA